MKRTCHSAKDKGPYTAVTFKSYVDANKLLLTNTNIINERYISYIPQRLLKTKGIIQDVGFSVSVEDVIEDDISSVKVFIRCQKTQPKSEVG